MGRQELNAELLTDNPGALWQRNALEPQQVSDISEMRRVASNLPITAVHASHGKWARAEPVAALYEQGRVSLAQLLARL